MGEQSQLASIATSSYVILFLASIAIALVLGPISIPLLRRLKFGQNIRDDGPQSHLKKAGTPTMGGVIFIVASVITMVLASILLFEFNFNSKGMVIIYSFIAFGFIGFLDDILKIKKKQSEGLKAWQKMILLVGFSVIIAVYCYVNIGTVVQIPFVDKSLDLGILYIPFVIFVFAAMTNAVNLTDGLDGLAGTVSVLVLTFFGFVALVIEDPTIVACIAIMIGALFGFLRYNSYPAKIFMGDTGSLALGGAIATIAIVMQVPFLLIIVGAIYVLEAVSVILQVTSFKLFKRRIFKMAPIHHHFEQCDWSEVKIVTFFSVITALLCLVGIMAL